MEIRRVAEGELTHKEFYNEYWKKGIPLVFKDASKIGDLHAGVLPLPIRRP